MEGGEPLDSGFHTNERTAHDNARAAVRPYLREHAQVPPMPESWVEAHYRRIVEHEAMKEAAARWVARIEDDGTIAGYEWAELCEENDYDVIDFYAGPDKVDSLQSIDLEEAA